MMFAELIQHIARIAEIALKNATTYYILFAKSNSVYLVLASGNYCQEGFGCHVGCCVYG